MARSEAIQVTGTVIGILPNNLYRVELPNGHQLLGHPAEKNANDQSLFLQGTKVVLTVSPYDLSKGKITGRQSQNSVALAGE